MPLTPGHDHAAFPSAPETVASVDSFLETRLQAAGFPDDLLADIAVSVSEVVNNAIVHGNHEDENKQVQIDLKIESDRVAISVQDEGEGFDPDKLPNPVAQENLLREVGRGLFIVRAYMDEVNFNMIGGRGLRITMVKFLPDGDLS
jgi:serine/threonine-protein kinase RsbW